jgi:putative ABC transport system permease protein
MKNLFRFIGLRHIRQKPLRTLLTFLGVAFGVALYVAISMINDSTRKSFRQNIESVSGKSKFVIGGGLAGFDEAKLEQIKSIEGVKAAVPMMENRAYLVGSTTAKESLFVLGVDLLQESAVRSYSLSDGKPGGDEGKRIIDDPLVFLNQPDSIIITETFANRNRLKIDSKIELATARGKKIFTVRGILVPEGAAKAYGGNLAIMDIDGARVMFAKEGKLDRVDILPRDGFDLQTLKENLKRNLGPAFTVEEPNSQGDSLEKMIESYQLMLMFFSSLALLVGLFLIYNSTAVSIAERRREIGVLRALGANQKNILALFIAEATTIGFFGSAFGCVLGKGLSYLLVDQVSAAVSNQYGTPIRITELLLHPDKVLFTLALGSITAAFAAFFPAFKASKVPPTEAMRARGMETFRSDGGTFVSRFGGVILYSASLLMMVFELPKYWKFFDQVGQGFSVLGAAFFGPVLVFFLIHLLKRFGKNSKRMLPRMARENLLRSRARTSSNVMALMVGLYFVMLVATVRASFQHTILSWAEDVLTADFIISSSGRFITAEVQPLDPKIYEELLKVPGVRNPGAGRGYRTRLTKVPYEGANIFVKAFDQPAEFSQYRGIALIGENRIERSRKFFESTEPVVIVSDNFLLKHPEKKVGDELRLETPSGPVNFRIFALAKDYASPEGVFYFPRKFYSKYWKDELVTGFGIYLEDPSKSEEVRRELDQRVMSRYGLVAISNLEMKKMMEDILDQSFAYTKAVEFAALLVALLGLLNTLLISVLERTREIGMMRAIGTTRKQIHRLILLESLIQGGFGAVIATLLGGVVGYFYVTYALGISMGWVIEFHLPLSSFLMTILTGVAVALIAGVLPARRASQLKIVDALDSEA